MYDVVFIGDLIESPTLNFTRIAPELLLSCRGEIGNFRLKYRENDKTEEIKTSTIVINIDAEKEKPVDDVSSFADDLPAVEELAGSEALIFIQDYSSLSPAVMSKEGLKKAVTVVDNMKDEDTQVYYFYRSMRFIEDNDSLFEEARKKGVVFLKFDGDNLEITGNDQIDYEREDISLQLEGKIFLAPEFKPAAASISRLARIFNLEMGDNGYLQAENVYLQPTLTGKRGVYILGGSRGPTAYSDFSLEAEYTLNEIESLLGKIEPIVSEEREVDDQKCILCYTCYRVCPHGAIERDEELDAMKILNLACQGCNSCISHCPATAISIVNAEEVQPETGLKVLMCENSAETAWKKLNKDEFSAINFETIPCAGSVEKQDMFSYLQNPDNRLLILGCFEESCQHLSGDQKADRMVNEVKDTLAKLNLGEDRITFMKLAPRMEEDLANILSSWKEGDL